MYCCDLTAVLHTVHYAPLSPTTLHSTLQLKREVLQSCSRHKAKWTPPATPEGFWNLTLETPDDWK